ncbi:hypothetical protein [Comamonas thiooxydans]|jgi:hypothetical protein|uniref:hypothetical protein n=2 Tax=Comamonas thiooxydans TaxID=363952 RepID=UPI000A869BCA|nr:hypothetical protein [Comamonas thiooxydans]
MQEFPSNFSLLEECQAMAILDEVRCATSIYDGDFKANWLLSPIHSTVWRVSKGIETRLIDGSLTNYFEYDWSTSLYDGTNLIDPVNKRVLEGVQRLAFLAREMPGGPNTLSTLKNFLWTLNFLVRWVYLNGDVLKPRQFGLTKITKQHFLDFFTDFGEGGTVFALRYPERILCQFFKAALGRQPTAEEIGNPLSLDRQDCCEVARWLQTKRAFERLSRSTSGNLMIKRGFLANLIGVDVKTCAGGGPRWRAFLAQFESPDEVFENQLDRQNASGRREYPSHKVISFEEARGIGVSVKSLGKYFDDIRIIVSLHRHLPEICPSPLEFKPVEIRQVITQVSEVSRHTPWIPLHIAMDYTTEALRWVHLYGEDLVSIFLIAYQNLYEKGLLVSAPKPKVNNPSESDYIALAREKFNAREQYVSSLIIPDSLKNLNLSGWGCYIHLDGNKAFGKLQDAPSLNDAIMVLVGAITVIVAMTKPMRESEFRSIKTDCLTLLEGDGYWLSQDIRKKNVGDIRPVDARPIPVIAARAIQLLRRLTDGVKRIVGVTDQWLLDSLVTLPSFGRYEARIVEVVSPAQLGAMLDAFCDYAALPPDSTGRRWYLRIHEMRKSFLITYFWTYRYANLDAARWMAGHNDASHLYAYIHANFPGEELPGLEAEYAAQVLRDYEQSGVTQETRHVADLYQAVCEHFSVRDVSWIDEGMLRDWLELQFESKEFQIVPYSIRSPDGYTATEIAFRVSAIKK